MQCKGWRDIKLSPRKNIIGIVSEVMVMRNREERRVSYQSEVDNRIITWVSKIFTSTKCTPLSTVNIEKELGSLVETKEEKK